MEIIYFSSSSQLFPNRILNKWTSTSILISSTTSLLLIESSSSSMEKCTFILTISCASHPPSMTGPNKRKNVSQFASNCLMGWRFLKMAVHARLNSLTTHRSGNAKQFVIWRHRITGNRADLSVIAHLSTNGISRTSNVKGSLNQ